MKKRYSLVLSGMMLLSGAASATGNDIAVSINQAKQEVQQLLEQLHQGYNECAYDVAPCKDGICAACADKLRVIGEQLGELAERLYQLELRLVYLEEDLNGTRLVIGEPAEEVVNFQELDSIEKINNAQLNVAQWLKTIYARLDSQRD